MDILETIETSIMNLPDDCLLAIFNQLSVLDLIAIYKTHKHFRTTVTYFVSVHYKSMHIKYSSYIGNYVISGIILNRLNLENFFETFGKCFETLTLEPYDYIKSDVAAILSLANSYCSGSIKRLTLNYVTINETMISKFSVLFKHLNGLKIISGIDNGTFEKTLIECENLKDLVINHEHLRPELFLSKISTKLERIWYCHNNMDISIQDIRYFLVAHPKLKVLSIANVFVASDECLNYLANVELLRLDMRSKIPGVCQSKIDWNRLFQLKHLRRFDLLFDQDISDSLLQVTSKPPTNVEILALTLNLNHFTNIFDLLNTFTFVNLRILTISYLSNGNKHIGFIDPLVIKRVVKKLLYLEQIQFFHFPCEGFEYLIEIVKASNSLKTVVLLEDDVNYSDISRLNKLIRSKQNELNSSVGVKLIIIKDSEEMWKYDYFDANF